MKRMLVLLLGAAVVLILRDNSARAFPQFKKAFEEKYVTAADANPALAAAFKMASCNTCHVKPPEGQEAERKLRNAYGQALAKHIEGDAKKRLDDADAKGGADAKKAEMKKLLEELDKAFSAVENEKSAAGTTYGEQLKAGKLPN